MTDPGLLRRAITLAIESVASGGGPFGALVVRDSRILGRGQNRVVPEHDPTAHAEIQAIREAARTLGTHELLGCELYSSCEPCPMCLGAIHWARIELVHFGCDRNDAAAAGFSDAWIYHELALPAESRRVVLRQSLRDEARKAFEAWKAKADRVPY